MKKILLITLLFLLSCQTNQTVKKDTEVDNIKSSVLEMKVTTGNLIIRKKK